MATITSAQREASFMAHMVGSLPFSGHEWLERWPRMLGDREEVGIYQPY